MPEECGETGHMGINYPTVPQDVYFVGNSNNGFRLNQGFNAGWNKLSFPFDNHQHGGNGQNFNRNEPSLRDNIRDQVRINDEVGKNIYATNKLLENINAKMDSFIVATQNQPSFNRMLETQIQQISATILGQTNGGSSKTLIQESVRSIFTMFKEKALKSNEGSLGGVGRDKKPSIAENFCMKSFQCVKNAMPTMTSSLGALAT
jgi:hypothetical protein